VGNVKQEHPIASQSPAADVPQFDNYMEGFFEYVEGNKIMLLNLHIPEGQTAIANLWEGDHGDD
jgi:hypothetical protein